MSQRSDRALRCATCGADNPPYATFCLECGDPFTGAPGLGQAARAPRPVPAARLALRPEIWLGVLLVLVVLGFAGADWWRQEDQAATYRAGQAAAGRHDWDQAATAFGRLGDYRDAARLLHNAQVQRENRNIFYRAGRDATARGDWIAAYTAFSATLGIQSTYSDTRRLYDTAAGRAVQAALANTIVRRVTGDAPGLYVTRPDGADWRLPDSDAQSNIWNISRLDDLVLYDAPLPPGAPSTIPRGGTQYMGRLLPTDRLLLAVPVGPAGLGAPHAVPPTVAEWDITQVTQGGLWLYDYANPGDTLNDVRGATLSRLSYYDLASDQTFALLPPSNNDYKLLNGFSSGPLLIAGYNLPGIGPGRTQLYHADPAAHALQPVALLDGIVTSAQFSADGRYLVYTTRVALPQPERRFDLGLLDLRDPARPVGSILASETDLLLLDLLPLQAGFIPGPGPPRLLVRGLHGSAAWLYVQKLDGSPPMALWEGPSQQLIGNGTTSELYWLDPSGQFVLFRVIDSAQSARLVVRPLDGAPPVAQVTVPFDSFPSFGIMLSSASRTADTYLLYGLEGYNGLPAIYSVLLHDPPVRAVALWQQPESGARSPLPLASGVLAYPYAETALGLRTFDGATELPPVAGVDMVWPIGQPPPAYLLP